MIYDLRIKKNILYLFCVLFCVGLALPTAGQAAEMFFVSSNQKPAANGLFEVDFFLNTQEEKINAIAGNVVFSSDLLELKEIRDGNSIINLWIDRPRVGGSVSFSGITPGGYNGERGLLFSLIFRSLKPGKISVNLVDGQALLNDGKGTAVKLFLPALVLSIGAEGSAEQADYSMADKTSPESFVPEIAQDNNIEGGKWFVVFATQDKESGIDHYEAQENKNNNPNGSWQIATSPYILSDQTLQSYIYIKAVDKAGNIALELINPKKLPFLYGKFLVYGMLLMGVIIFGILGLKLWRRKGG